MGLILSQYISILFVLFLVNHLIPRLVNDEDPDAQRKVLAGEVFRHVGGLLLNASGDRFCNETGPADSELNRVGRG